MEALASKIDPELHAMSQSRRRRVFMRRLPRYARTNREFNDLYAQYKRTLDSVETPMTEEERAKREGFATYIKPNVSDLGKPPLPDIIKQRHNWDDIPRFMNFHKNVHRYGDYTHEELSLLAKQDLVQISPPAERATGPPEFIERLREKNPDVIVLGYRNLALNHGQFSGKLFKEHPEWHLKDTRTGEYTVHGTDTRGKSQRPLYDLRIPGMREWWLNDIGRQLTTPGHDGILIDACAKAITPFGPRVNATGRSEGGLLSYNEHINDLLLANITRNGGKGMIVANALRSIYADCLKSYVDVYFHGSYLEAIEQRTSVLYDVHLVKMIDTCVRMQKEDPQKVMIFNLAPHYPPPPLQRTSERSGGKVHMFDDHTSMGDGALAEQQTEMREVFEYKLSLALIMATQYSYIGYAGTHAIHDDKSLWAPEYPEWDRRLGPPQGPAKKTGTHSYARGFKYASVLLNIALRKGTVTWR